MREWGGSAKCKVKCKRAHIPALFWRREKNSPDFPFVGIRKLGVSFRITEREAEARLTQNPNPNPRSGSERRREKVRRAS
jgi:hypothetical protein